MDKLGYISDFTFWFIIGLLLAQPIWIIIEHLLDYNELRKWRDEECKKQDQE